MSNDEFIFMEPQISIEVDEEPCGCPEMLHNTHDFGGDIYRNQLMHMKNYADNMMHLATTEEEMPFWVEKKMTLVNDYLASMLYHWQVEIYENSDEFENNT